MQIFSIFYNSKWEFFKNIWLHKISNKNIKKLLFLINICLFLK